MVKSKKGWNILFKTGTQWHGKYRYVAFVKTNPKGEKFVEIVRQKLTNENKLFTEFVSQARDKKHLRGTHLQLPAFFWDDLMTLVGEIDAARKKER